MTSLRPALHSILALLLGGVFLYASVDKIWNPGDFARIVYHYRILGPSQHVGPLPANLLAVTLPWIEALGGALLIAGLWRREAAAVCALMLVGFVAAVSLALAQGIDIENCGCFSVTGAGRAAGIKLILGDLALLAAALVLALCVPARGAAAAPAPAQAEASQSAS